MRLELIKWKRFGLLPFILFILLILSLLWNKQISTNRLSSKKTVRGMLQIMDFSTDKGEPEESEISSLANSEEDIYSLRSWMKKRANLYRLRGERVDQVCEEFNVSLNTSSSSITDYINKQTKMDKDHFVERISLDQFSLSRPHRTMGCLINKVASTSFNKALLFLDGFPVRNITSPHAFKSKLNPKNEEELKFAEKHFTKFLIVREPMERLASCYLDKAVTNTHWSLGAFRKGIVRRSKFFETQQSVADNQRTRRKRDIDQFLKLKYSAAKSSENTGKSYLEHQRSLASPSPAQKLAGKVSVPKRLKIQPKPEDIPTFTQFLQYILSTDLLGNGFESHWVPYWRACTPCHFKYDVIGKLETGEDDFTYLWKLNGLDSEVPIPWEHKRGSSNQTYLKELYSGVPRDLLIKVYRAYELDYLMFGYDFNKVLITAGYPTL